MLAIMWLNSNYAPPQVSPVAKPVAPTTITAKNDAVLCREVFARNDTNLDLRHLPECPVADDPPTAVQYFRFGESTKF